MAPVFMLLFAQSSTANPAISISFTAGTSPVPLQSTITVSGSLVYESFYGVQSTWSHWIINDKISIGSDNSGQTTATVSTSWLTIFVKSLISTDAGTLYCAYTPANTATGSEVGITNGLTLTLTAKSATSATSAANRLLQKQQQQNHLFTAYSLLILTASSKIFI